MMDQFSLSKAQRLNRISYFLYKNPRGLSASELARLCGVSKRTAQRDLNDLDDMGIPIWEEEGQRPRYGICEGYYIPPVRLSLDEAVALYLAARLLARYADSYDPHIASALGKLATILPDPISPYVHATVTEVMTRQEDVNLIRVMSTLALGWSSGRKVRITHRSLSSEQYAEHVLRPYFLEPSTTGNATYVIGYADDLGELRTFKVERIRSAELLSDTFEVPESFDGPALLRTCWGIMYGEEIERVALRFSPSATRRLKETAWHPSQEVTDCDAGGCELRLDLAHPEEMIYWIRGWGPQVEVLEPTWLREHMAEEARQMGRLYQEAPK